MYLPHPARTTLSAYRSRPSAAPVGTAQPATAPAASHAAPPLTVEWLVARDIDAYTARRRAQRAGHATGLHAPATMDAQASTRPSPVSLRKNGTRAVGHAQAASPQ